MMAHDAHHMVEQVSVRRTIEPLLFAGLGEGLTRKTGAENVMPWDRLRLYRSDVRERLDPEVFLVGRPKVLLLLARKYAIVAELRQGEMKAAKASEEVDKSHGQVSGER